MHLPFNFSLLETPWNARAIGRAVDRYEALLPPGGWPNWVLGNHDRPRVASRIGQAQARIAAMLLMTLRGTPTLYYGDEIGCRRCRFRRTASAIRSSATCLASVATGAAHPCNGMRRPARGFRPRRPGCR